MDAKDVVHPIYADRIYFPPPLYTLVLFKPSEEIIPITIHATNVGAHRNSLSWEHSIGTLPELV